jgi:hypothetical protein
MAMGVGAIWRMDVPTGPAWRRLPAHEDLSLPYGGRRSAAYEPELEAAAEYGITGVAWLDLRRAAFGPISAPARALLPWRWLNSSAPPGRVGGRDLLQFRHGFLPQVGKALRQCQRGLLRLRLVVLLAGRERRKILAGQYVVNARWEYQPFGLDQVAQAGSRNIKALFSFELPAVTRRLLEALATNAPPKHRDEEAAIACARAARPSENV